MMAKGRGDGHAADEGIPSGDRLTYSADEGSLRAERRAAPKPARIPSGDRPTYSSDEGLS